MRGELTRPCQVAVQGPELLHLEGGRERDERWRETKKWDRVKERRAERERERER